ncbi:uncharacterized protein VTP21DRAFT_7855 [Calcarisporiella thermophila]|uniref:uncharacterized protein n=1 Tax=Calcarisporiella thermophila TaxID=911321 RepID=UPI003742F69E
MQLSLATARDGEQRRETRDFCTVKLQGDPSSTSALRDARSESRAALDLFGHQHIITHQNIHGSDPDSKLPQMSQFRMV